MLMIFVGTAFILGRNGLTKTHGSLFWSKTRQMSLKLLGCKLRLGEMQTLEYVSSLQEECR